MKFHAIVLLTFVTAGAYGQQSKLVQTGSDGKLIYATYANEGENNSINKADPLLRLWYQQPAANWNEALPVGKVKYTSNGVEYTRETFVSYPDQLLVIRWRSSKAGALNFQVAFDNPMPSEITS